MDIKPILCPACKSPDIYIDELWENSIQWAPGDASKEGTIVEGHPTKVRGNCHTCKNTWTLRKYRQVSKELINRLKANREILDGLHTR